MQNDSSLVARCLHASLCRKMTLDNTRICVGAAGYFARDPSVLRRVGDVLLDPSTRSTGPLKRWLVGKDAFNLAEEASRHALYQVPMRSPFARLPCDLDNAWLAGNPSSQHRSRHHSSDQRAPCVLSKSPTGLQFTVQGQL